MMCCNGGGKSEKNNKLSIEMLEKCKVYMYCIISMYAVYEMLYEKPSVLKHI